LFKTNKQHADISNSRFKCIQGYSNTACSFSEILPTILLLYTHEWERINLLFWCFKSKNRMHRFGMKMSFLGRQQKIYPLHVLRKNRLSSQGFITNAPAAAIFCGGVHFSKSLAGRGAAAGLVCGARCRGCCAWLPLLLRLHISPRIQAKQQRSKEQKPSARPIFTSITHRPDRRTMPKNTQNPLALHGGINGIYIKFRERLQKERSDQS